MAGCPGVRAQASGGTNTLLEPPSSLLWNGGIGDGFRRGVEHLGIGVGPGFGMTILGSSKAHDWGMIALQYGIMPTRVWGENRWYRGNLELGGQLFGAAQYRPDGAYVVGGGPLLRYNFATGSRWMPFVQIGSGLTATDIRNGDLSTTFEFTLQGGVGVHYFLRENLALTAQYLFVHLSNAGMQRPNLGVNNSTFLFGLTWFFP